MQFLAFEVPTNCNPSPTRHRHPATTWNQKKIWEAEQKHEKRKKDEERANKELSRDIDRRHYEQMANGQSDAGSSRTVDFMYAPPPGFQQASSG